MNTDDPAPFAQAESIILEKLRFAAAARLSPYVAHNLDVEFINSFAEHLVIRLSSAVLAKQIPPVVAMDYREVEWFVPASWWQHWKADHEDAWYARAFVRRWPVRRLRYSKEFQLKVNLDGYWIWPDAAVLPPEFGTAVPVHMVHQTTDILGEEDE